VQQNWRSRGACISRMSVVLALLLGMASSSFAQKTVEQNAGGGRKIQIDYDADGHVTQMRSVGPDGKLQQKTDYVRIPNFLGPPQETTTSYFPDGKVSKVTKVTYDESSNFTGEFIQVYNQSGSQIDGHELKHDPMTNFYTCADWNTAAQNYKRIECPAGEESGGPEQQLKKFTYEEVAQHLSHARQAAVQERKQAQMQPMTLVKPPITTNNREVGLVLPAQLHPGARASGSIVEDPDNYDGLPGVTVTRVILPFLSVGEASKLSGWTFEVAGEKPQAADLPFTFIVPGKDQSLDVTFRQGGNPAQAVSKTMNLPSSGSKMATPKSFQAAALCLKGELCLVSGPFRGDSTETLAAFEDRPASVVAETTDAAYISIPKAIEPGHRPLFIAEGSKVVAFPVTVASFVVKNVDREIKPPETLITFPTLDGPADIPDALWRTGNYPSTNLEEARKLVPGFQLPRTDHAAREKREAEEKQKSEPKEKREVDEKKGGMLLLVLKNMTPDQVSLRGAKDQTIVFRLNDESFSRGEFKYDLVVEALKPGHFVVKGYVIPFLAPVAGQEFVNKDPAQQK
jgi:hypothetical protein